MTPFTAKWVSERLFRTVRHLDGSLQRVLYLALWGHEVEEPFLVAPVKPPDIYRPGGTEEAASLSFQRQRADVNPCWHLLTTEGEKNK